MTVPTDTVANSDFPAVSAVAYAKSDTANLPSACRGVYVGTTGDIAAVMNDDSVVIFASFPAGQILPVRVKRINSTSTTAGSFVALY